MIRNGVIAAAAVLALGTVAMATDASAREMHGTGGSGGGTGTSRNVGGGVSAPRASVSTRGNIGGYARTGAMGARTGYERTNSNWNGARTHYSRTTSLNRSGYTRSAGFTRSGRWDRDEFRHRRFGRGWGPGFGIGFAAADYGYGYGYDYDYDPG
jgi:hypothetical protein